MKSSGSLKKKKEEPTPFAKIESISDRYKLSFDLKYFQGFKSEECNVEVKGRDLFIDCKKQKVEKQDVGFKEAHVIYQLPDDIDASTVKMTRDGMKLKIEAMRISYGKPLSLAVCDVTKKNANVITVGGMA
uniref:SHSP domain-containing protein n=1 Tax=Plectus sambesii TaxID=2011161 RepID=A0A914X866_9BILA